MITATAHQSIRPRLSRPLLAVLGILFAAGLAQGVVVFARRPPVPAEHLSGTAAWWPHALLALLTAVFSVGGWVHRRRSGRRGSVLLLPLSERAVRRTRRTFSDAVRGRGSWRLVALLPAAVLLYGAYRAGLQVTGGLDPDFTVNAWGGPSYLGAMACHYLDALLMMAAAAWLLDKILLPDNRREATTAFTASAGPPVRSSPNLQD
ncbi:hypothetical protein [Gordonia sp. (in: high G+C Gram-positive bacteria)]|uniref:hypothetical protein n=1 Tax=Gordonia sp. (in: high G+C Gram-positive bacteria) TaxID=84139 RepID=UPI003F99154A